MCTFDQLEAWRSTDKRVMVCIDTKMQMCGLKHSLKPRSRQIRFLILTPCILFQSIVVYCRATRPSQQTL